MPVRQKSRLKRHASSSTSELQSLRRELKTEKAARKAAEAEVTALQWKADELLRELRGYREAKSETENFLRNEIRRLEKAVKERDQKLEDANQQLEWLRREYFTSNTETVTPSTTERSWTRKHRARKTVIQNQ